jgi:hypothetical protein
MKLSTQTLGVLKNFASINPNVVVNQGNVIKTIAEAKNILATATVSETFPMKFGLYDLNNFLGAVGMYDEVELSFAEDGNSVILNGTSDGVASSLVYHFSDTAILTTPQKDITMPECEIVFDLTDSQLNQLRKASSALGVSEVVVVGEEDGSDITVRVTDIADATSNKFDLKVTPTKRPEGSFNLVYNIANFKFLPGGMTVSISSKLISQFENADAGVSYWVALEKSSKFGG